MPKPLKFFLFLLPVFFFLLPKLTLADGINSFDSRVQINTDSSIKVTETIVYDFGTTAHHGIYRDIPYTYQTGLGNYTLRIAVNSVTDQNNKPYTYTVSKTNGNVEVKIGDANVTITGVHTYVLTYTVQGAINYYSDHDELYWNATGNNWDVPITRAQAEVLLPNGANYQQVQMACFAGAAGSRQACISGTDAINGAADVTEADFVQNQLTAGQGLTLVVGWQKGLVHQPTKWQVFLQTLEDNWGLGLPVLAFLLMFYLWYSRGKDPSGFSTIVPQYEAPAGLTPTEAGTILDETAGNKDISAEIINLAVMGYLKITRLQEKILGLFNHTDYQLDKLKDGNDLPNDFEKQMMTALFGGASSVKLSSLKNKFYTDLLNIRKAIFQSVVDKGYFPQNLSTVRGIYTGIAVVLTIVSFYWGSSTQNIYNFLGLLISAFIVGIFGYFMPKRTVKGAQAKQYILGLKMYLSVAEADRLKFFDAPDKTPDRFEKLLPYAIVLGVEKEWAKQFEGLYNQPPRWYYDPYGGAFNSILFVSSLNSFSQSTSATFASHPGGAGSGASGFGGGGFSGGGFGGGGGGGW